MSQGATQVTIPPGNECCDLSIINTTCDITVPPSLLVEPAIDGFEWINLPTYSFYIKHRKSGKQLLFDLGARKDWENHVPHIRDLVANFVNGFRVKKDVVETIGEAGIDLKDIDAFVLSHYHFDHAGAPSALPKSTKLIVGPGFKDSFLPGYPSNEKSTFHEADFEGRDVIEVPFSDFKIGAFEAYDYFGDGSFYLLNVPGHAIGHISGLVRTTPDTFVFLGGDVCHFTGVIRPTNYISLPDEIPAEAFLDHRISRPCPCSAFLSCHPDPNNSKTTPFLKVSTGEHSFYSDPKTAQQSVTHLQEFDANPNILIAIAHDPTSLDVFDFFPAQMNDWKEKNWKRVSHWGFLSELPYNGKTLRPQLVDGLYKDGNKIYWSGNKF